MTDWLLFFIAALMLNLTPGSDMLYVISRSLSQGFKGGLYSALGIFTGGLVHISAAIFGLSILIARSAFWFGLIQYAGAAYLVYLGVQAVWSRTAFDPEASAAPVSNYGALFKQGVLTNALNPKVAVFFLSFLPQFVDPASHQVQWQLFVLGMWFDVQGTLILILVAWLVGRTARLIRQNPQFWSIQGKLTGLILIGLGIKLALTTRK